MELMSWGLLIGVVGMVWILVASSIRDNDSQDEGQDLDSRSAVEEIEMASAEIKEREAKAAA